MGQRFQIIENTNGRIKVYHIQWLWGGFTIRRIGTTIKNFLKHNQKGFRSFEDFLKGSFYGKPDDMNSFDRYFNDSERWDDNKEICTSWKGKKKFPVKRKSFVKLLRYLDNNDGYFYIEFSDKFINGQRGLKGYCFILNGWNKEDKDYKPISAKQYMEGYKKDSGFSNKTQEKEFLQGMKTFEKLPVIPFPKFIEGGLED